MVPSVGGVVGSSVVGLYHIEHRFDSPRPLSCGIRRGAAMSIQRVVLGTVALALTVLAPAARADGAAWVAPVSGCVIITAFGESYPGGTHRGVDLRAPSGAEVAVPAAGRVTFAGSVPADGGGRCGAVTVETADGLRVSLLPLALVFVTGGEEVVGGETVGIVAATGDDSNAEPHVHLGLRRGDTYLDPTGMLPSAEVVSPVAPDSQPVPDGPGEDVPPAESPPVTGDTVADVQSVDTVASAGQSRCASGSSAAAPSPGAVTPQSSTQSTGEGRTTQGGAVSAATAAQRGGAGHRQIPHGAGIASDTSLAPGGPMSRAAGFRVPAVAGHAEWGVAAACMLGAIVVRHALRDRGDRVFVR
jgi:murein DD-endopeptidase MepM/ murein hydrolase activator NlpD